MDRPGVRFPRQGQRLRYFGLPGHRPHLWHHGRPGTGDRRGKGAGHPGDAGHGCQPHLGSASLVPGEPEKPGEPLSGLLYLAGREGGRPPHQLGLHLFGPCLDAGPVDRAVLYAQLPAGTAGSQLGKSGGAGSHLCHHAVLAGKGRGRVPAGRDQHDLQGPTVFGWGTRPALWKRLPLYVQRPPHTRIFAGDERPGVPAPRHAQRGGDQPCKRGGRPAIRGGYRGGIEHGVPVHACGRRPQAGG